MEVSRQHQSWWCGQHSRDGIDDDGVGGLIAVDASFKSRADRGRGLDDDLIPWTLGAGRHGEIEGDLVGILVGPTADLMYSLHRAVRVDDGLDGFLNLVHRPSPRMGDHRRRLRQTAAADATLAGPAAEPL